MTSIRRFDHLLRPAIGVAVIVAMLTALVVVAGFGGRSVESTVAHGLITLILVLGLGAFVGNSGVLSFGHVSFMALAAYASALLTLPLGLKARLLPDLPPVLAALQLDFVFALPIALVVVGVVGLLCGLFVARLGGAAAAIATLGLLIITNSVLVGAANITRGSQALYGIPKVASIWLILIFACLALAVVRAFRGSRAGLLLQASREDEPAACAIGVDIARVRFVGWTVSVVIMALGGVLFAHNLGVFSPKEFYFSQTFTLLVMLIVGGMASTSGAVVGTGAVLVVVEVLRRVEEGGIVFGIQVPQMFGLTEIGLAVAVLIALYRRGTGLMGYRELEHWILPRADGGQAGGLRAQSAKRYTDVESVSVGGASRRAEPVVGRSLRAACATKTYGGVTALNGVELALQPGEILGLIGPNGSGKSTLLSLLAGTQPPTEGRILLDSRDVSRKPAHRIALAGVGRTFQTVRLFSKLTVLENVEAALLASRRAWGRAESRELASRMLERLGIEALAGRSAEELAYGQQRRLEIARALALDPHYLLLDEPAAGMNEAESGELIAFLSGLRRTTGIGILIVEHDLHLIMRLCDRVAVLNKGDLIALGSPGEVRAHPAVVAAYFGGRSNAGISAVQ